MKPTTISLLQKCKQEKKRFATITAYDYSFAKLFAEEGINVMLVGDSLGMTVQGHDSTLPVTVEDIAYHTRAVRRGAPACLLLSDLPFMAYATPEQAFENAATVMRAGANMVKIEGGAWLVDTVKMLTDRAVPVCGHLGLTPQSVNIFGGYKVQGRGDAAQTLFDDAVALEAAGAQLLRGGAFKPRTSPYAFQGLKAEGLELLKIARQETGLPIVTEIMNISTLDLFADVDIIQVGARNMQNFDLLKELGKTDKPILLKRGLANTLQELLMSAEYIMSEGNSKVILCERGIRTFETATRNTLDLSAVPVLHNLTHLPVVVDPSHATGKADLVAPMAYAATAAGADGIMVEVHNDPAHALCDGAQSITPPQFDEISRKVRQIREVLV